MLLAIFIAIPLAVYLRYHEKLDWVLRVQNFELSVSGLIRLFTSKLEPCLLTALVDLSDFFPDFAASAHWAKRGIDSSLQRLGAFWDD